MSPRRSFRDLPIRAKLRAIILIIGGLAIASACASWSCSSGFRSERMAHRLEVMADVVGDQSTAALEFDQPAQSANILRSLKAEHQIMFAAIYTRRAGSSPASPARESIRARSGSSRSGRRTSEGDDVVV